MRKFSVALDTAYQNTPLNETGLLQGNQNFSLEVRLFERGTPVTIDNMKKPKLIFHYAYGSIPVTVEESSPDYPITIADNVITVAANPYMTRGYGKVRMQLLVDDVYTYSLVYEVGQNQGFIAPPISATDAGAFALKDLTNVSNPDFTAKAKAVGLTHGSDLTEYLKTADLEKESKKLNFAQNDLEDVDLAKPREKSIAASMGLADLTNVSPTSFNRELQQNKAFQLLENRHPNTAGLTADGIKKLFYANRYEETQAVDLTAPPFDSPTTLLLVYQITSEGQTITQVLPPHDRNQIVMVELLFSRGITSGSVEIDTVPGEHLEGDVTNNSVTFSEQGYVGMFLPLRNDAGYEFISHHSTAPFSLSVGDDRGNIVMGADNLKLESPLYLEHNESTKETLIKIDPVSLGGSITVTDGILGKDFTAKKLQSVDKTVRMAELGTGIADLSVDLPHIKEGVFATLGYTEPINTNFHDQRPYFTPRWAHMSRYVGEDRNEKGWTIQEGDGKDPNVTGGTPFHFGMWFNPENNPVASGDGYLELKVVDIMTET